MAATPPGVAATSVLAFGGAAPMGASGLVAGSALGLTLATGERATSGDEAGAGETCVAAADETAVPRDSGHGAFLELQTGMNGGWSVGWVWSSKPEPQPDDFEPLSEFVWWMPPGKTTCFS